ncbi:MAG: ABC transporter ATP-binding protein [Deltaproteobacteria bacterium]|nr:ABC transporter ATP-binding protein [Deltaproteobacteria bacterium]
MICLENVSRTYGEGAASVHAIRDVTASIEAGAFVTIVGASGSGKSTLLNLIGTLDRPTSGRILLDGVEIFNLNDRERTLLRREKIGFVFQFFNLLPTLTALENVALPAKLMGKSAKETSRRAWELLDRVGLSQRAEHKPDQMSGGEMQRVAIARALMMDPPVILADEPTGNLDSAIGRVIIELLRGAVDAKRTVVLVTHDLKLAEQGDRILTIEDGRLARQEAGKNRSSEVGP